MNTLIRQRWDPVPHAFSLALVVVCAAACKLTLGDLGSGQVWLIFYPAVVAAAIIGGRPAGLSATAFACLAVSWAWPVFSDRPMSSGPAEWLGELAFIVGGVGIAVLAPVARATLSRVDALNTLVAAMDEGFCVVEMICDPAGRPVDYRFLETNLAFDGQTGLPEPKGKTIREMVPGHESHWFEIYGKVAETGRSVRFENPAAAMGRYYDVFAFRIGPAGSKRVGILFKDISDRKTLERQLLLNAEHDELTGLNNRKSFNKYLAMALARAERSKQNLALLFIDLDDFKAVNDTLGHQAGDSLLRQIAQRLTACLRAGDLVSRLGGDEFTVVLENCQLDYLPALAESLVGVIGAPVDLGGQCAKVSASIGIATYPGSATTHVDLISAADAAMYDAKGTGKNRYRFAS